MKVNVGRQGNGSKHPHNLIHDVSTTASFGFCQPILQRELISKDSINLQIAQVVRLNPLINPTFGDVKLKTYTSFVLAEDIFHPFASLLTGTTYKGSSGVSYIPQDVPHGCLQFLYALLIKESYIYKYEYSNSPVPGSVPWDGPNVNKVWRTFSVSDVTPTADMTAWYTFYHGVFDAVLKDFDIDDFRSYLLLLGVSSLTPSQYFPAPSTGFNPDHSMFDWFMVDYDNKVVYCGRLTAHARNLRKIFIGLGYQLNMSTTPISFMPIFAYYKAWYDLFAIQRDSTWKDTACFSCLEWMEQNAETNIPDVDVGPSLHLMERFFADLCCCYYTIDPDYASAHITGVSTPSVETGRINFLDEHASSRYIYKDSGTNAQAEINTGHPTGSVGRDIQDKLTVDINKLTALGGRLEDKMRVFYNAEYHDMHKSIALGQQSVDAGILPIFSTNESSDVKLGEFAGQGYGDNRTNQPTIKFTADAQGFLICMCCVVPISKMSQGVDPLLYHLSRWDFFNEKYDAVTLLPTRKSCIYGNQEMITPGAEPNYDSGFGNIPNYTEYKVKNNILNGDMSIPSRRDSYKSFTVDKILPYRESRTDSNLDVYLGNLSPYILVAGDFWRYIGLRNWFGQFDRIFVNSGMEEDSKIDLNDDIDDNFIIQNIVKLNILSVSLPLADSFDTGVQEGETYSVEKS